MGRWLTLAALAVLALALLVLRELGHEAVAAPVLTVPPADVVRELPAAAHAPVVAAPVAKAGATADEAAAEAAPARMDVESDAFFYAFQEMVPKVLSRNAATCYEGIAQRVHRNQKLVLTFKTRIRDGVVTIHDVVASTNTLDNAALAACFLQQVQRSTWTDPALPDWEADDELVIRPERGLRKYLRESQDPAP